VRARTAQARQPRALARLTRRFSCGKDGKSVSPVAALPLTNSLARAVALGADKPAEGVESTRPADALRHPPHKEELDEAATPAP
jgi:hypothetical protein